MRGQILKISICIGIIFAGIAGSSAQTPSADLRGWRDFRFGMTLPETRNVKGFSWGGLSTTGGGLKFAVSRDTVQAYGANLRVSLYFNAGKLFNIKLTDDTVNPPEACDASYRKLISTLETSYGVFQPTGIPSGSVYRIPHEQSVYRVFDTQWPDYTGVTRIGRTENSHENTRVQVTMTGREDGHFTKTVTEFGETDHVCVLSIFVQRKSAFF